MKRELNYETLRAIGQWLAVRATEGKPVAPRDFAVDAEHSMRGGLLERLLAGKGPLIYPPPLFMSRPWYEIVDAGAEGLRGEVEVWAAADKGERIVEVLGDVLHIGQHPWAILERRPREEGPPEYLIEWRGKEADGGPSRWPPFLCTWLGRGDFFDRWWIRPAGAVP